MPLRPILAFGVAWGPSHASLGASVTVDGEMAGSIEGPGLLVYLGVTHDDGADHVTWKARKIWDLRLLRGVFGADMRVASINDGSVTLILESPGQS